MVSVHLIIDEKDEGIVYKTVNVPVEGEIIHLDRKDETVKIRVGSVKNNLKLSEDGTYTNFFTVNSTTVGEPRIRTFNHL